MKFYYTYKAARDLENLPIAIQKRIAQKMRFYAEQENPLKFAERLTEPREGEFRFRIGDYRVIFDASKNQIIILAI
jgi:mRNA interferase RelE/StbE